MEENEFANFNIENPEDILGFCHNYLLKINKVKYEFLIANLLKISLLEEDESFSRLITVLNSLSKDNFHLAISDYLEYFYLALVEKKLEIAKCYLEIISNISKLGPKISFIDNLYQIFNKIQSQTLQEEKTSKDRGENFIPEVEDIFDNLSDLPDFTDSAFQLEDNGNYLEREIANCYDKGVVVLEPMSKLEMAEVRKIIQKTPNIICFTINYQNVEYLVLKQQKITQEWIDYKKIGPMATKAYKEKDYDTCLAINRKLLLYGNPKAMGYSNIGLAYLKKGDLKPALDCFRIATALSQKEDGRFDYRDLIFNLELRIKQMEKSQEALLENKVSENSKHLVLTKKGKQKA